MINARKIWPALASSGRSLLSSFRRKHIPLTLARFMSIERELIRNFAIIAHVDHGKSTLADRLLEATGTISKSSENPERILDSLQVEKERGITVKSQTASMKYTLDGDTYLLNLIDTPGHIDFNFEVSRSLTAIQGVVLLVDANEGVQAQTIGNYFLAMEQEVSIIPALNKIDLKKAVPDLVAKQLQDLFDIEPKDIIRMSAKLGTGVDELLRAIVERVPPPDVDPNGPLKALTFDSHHAKGRGDHYRCSLLVASGAVEKGSHVSLHSGDVSAPVKEVGIFKPHPVAVDQLRAGEVGYAVLPFKDPSVLATLVGDTLYDSDLPKESVVPFHKIKTPVPMVYAGIFADQLSELDRLKGAIDKLCLNDSSVSLSQDSNPALGPGWRLGFLGILHMEIFLQRLEQEFETHPVVTLPNVPYRVKLRHERHIKEHGGKEIIEVISPLHFPEANHIKETFEPTVQATILCPLDYLEDILGLLAKKRATNENVSNVTDTRYMVTCNLPLAEIITDFNDTLKRITSGLGSFDYEEGPWQAADIVRVDFTLNKNVVEEFSMLAHTTGLQAKTRLMVDQMVKHIPRHMFEVDVRAVIHNTKTVLAKGRINQYRKDVFQKLHGSIGVERRQAMQKKQNESKKKLKMIGQIQVPKKAFVEIFRSSPS